jgi:hypothetical protein
MRSCRIRIGIVWWPMGLSVDCTRSGGGWDSCGPCGCSATTRIWRSAPICGARSPTRWTAAAASVAVSGSAMPTARCRAVVARGRWAPSAHCHVCHWSAGIRRKCGGPSRAARIRPARAHCTVLRHPAMRYHERQNYGRSSDKYRTACTLKLVYPNDTHGSGTILRTSIPCLVQTQPIARCHGRIY